MTTHEMTIPAGAAGDRPTAWRTFWLCFGSWTLNAMDMQIFGPVMGELPEAMRGTDADVVLIGTATLMSSAFGGWLAGGLSDRIGRVLTLQCTIAWFAGFTFLCAFAHTYEQLFVLRVLMAIGFGGQWAAAAVLVGEAFGRAHRGWAVGAMQSGWAVGWAIAFGMPALLPAIGWKVPFLFLVGGALPALLIPCVYLFVEESQVFADTQEKMKVAGKTADFLEIFSPNRLKTTFWTCVLSIGALSGYYVIVLWLPTVLAERNRAIPEAWYLAILIFGSFGGYLVSGWLSDHELLKRRGNFVLFASGAILTVFAHIYIPADETIILVLAFPLGFFASGTFSGMGAFFTELFPTRMRGAGVGFSYNFGRGFSAVILWLVGGAGLPDLPQWQTPAGGESNPAVSGAGLSQALLVGMFVLIAYGLVIIAALRLRETRNEEDKLDTDIEEPQKIGRGAHQLS